MLEFSIVSESRNIGLSNGSIVLARVPDSFNCLGYTHIVGLELVKSYGNNHCRQIQQPAEELSCRRMLVYGDIVDYHRSLLG